MAQIGDILDVASVAGGQEVSTGTKGFNLVFGTPKHVLAFPKGFKIANTIDLTFLYALGEVQKGNIIPLLNAKTVTSEGGDDTIDTDEDGVKTLGTKALPEFTATYKDGNQLYKELAKLEGYANFDFVLIDVEGNWKVATEEGYIKGFLGGQVTPGMTTLKVSGGDPEQKPMNFQLLDRDQYDSDYSIIQKDKIGWHIRDLDGINPCTLSFNTAPVAGSTVVVKVLLSDGVTVVSGLGTDDFKAMVDDTNNVVSNAVEAGSTGVYTLTLTDAISANDVINIQLYDSSEVVNAVILANAVYRGITDDATVA